FRVCRERGYVAALPGVRVKLPAMIGALEIRAIEPPEGERKRAMRAYISQRKWLSSAVAPDDERHVQQDRPGQLACPQPFAPQGGVPESPQHLGAGAARLGVVHRRTHPSTASPRCKAAPRRLHFRAARLQGCLLAFAAGPMLYYANRTRLYGVHLFRPEKRKAHRAATQTRSTLLRSIRLIPIHTFMSHSRGVSCSGLQMRPAVLPPLRLRNRLRPAR